MTRPVPSPSSPGRPRTLGLALAVLALAAFPAPSSAQTADPVADATLRANQATERMNKLKVLMLTVRDCKSRNEKTLGAPCTREELEAEWFEPNEVTRRLGVPNSADVRTRKYGNLPAFLVASHGTYKALKEEAGRKSWITASGSATCQSNPAGCETLGGAIQAFDDALQDVKQTVHDLLTKENLYWPLAAVLRTAFVIADPGDEDTETFERSELTAKNSAAGAVDFELRHWRDEESPVDYSIDGRFGYAPVMAIGRRRGQTGPVSTQKLIPLFQNGFIWEVGFKGSWQISNGELAGLYKTGQTRLSDLAVKLGSDENAQLADVVRNGVGRFAWRHDIGAQFRFYGVSLPLAHHDASRLLTPLLSAAVGLRLDERFNNEGDLQAFPDSSNKRWFAKFSVNILQFLRDGAPKPNDPMGVRIAVDYDGPFGGSTDLRFPSSTRLFIEGNADLLKLFGFGGSEAKK